MRYLLIVFLLVCQNLNAQVDNPEIFGNFPYGDSVDFSYTSDIKCIGDFYYFIVVYIHKNDELSLKSHYISVIKTDMNFNVLKRLDSLKLNNLRQNLSYIIYSNEDEGYALLAGNQFKEDKSLYNILKLNLQTLEVHRTDSIQLPSNDLILNNTYFKQINDTTLATFGHIENVETQSNNVFLFTSISTSGKVMQFKELVYIDLESNIPGFEYLEESELYFINIAFEDYCVFDQNLNLTQRVDAEFHAIGGLSNATLDSRFIDAENGFIHCIGQVGYVVEQNSVTHLRLPIIGDSIGEIDQVDPLLEVSKRFLSEDVIPASDEAGNVLIVLDDQVTIPGLGLDTTTLYILKTNLKDYGYRSNEWFISFSNNNDMSVRAAGTDKNGDFIIVGGYWNEEFYGKLRNFYLKVKSDGTITDTKGPVPDELMVIYPNPTYGSVILKSDKTTVQSYAAYDVHGTILKQAEITGRGKVELNELSAGTYFLVFKDRKGKIVGKSKMVKY